jgi:hypothetical protein
MRAAKFLGEVPSETEEDSFSSDDAFIRDADDSCGGLIIKQIDPEADGKLYCWKNVIGGRCVDQGNAFERPDSRGALRLLFDTSAQRGLACLA